MSTPNSPQSAPLGATLFPANGSGFGDVLEWIAGDTEPFQFTVLDEDDDPVDVTGYDFWFTVKERLEAGAPALIEKRLGQGIGVPDPTNGKALVFLNSADTEQLTPGRRYFYDIQLRTAATFIQTVKRGFFVTTPQVTTDHS